jgi:hypothetical protein
MCAAHDGLVDGTNQRSSNQRSVNQRSGKQRSGKQRSGIQGSNTMRKPGYLAAATAVLIAAGLAAETSAAPISIVNARFADTTGLAAFNEFDFGQPVGWSFYDPDSIVGGDTGSNGIFNGALQPNGVDFFDDPAPEGSKIGILFAFGDQAGAGTGEYGFEQTLGDVLAANTHYELSVDVGNIDSGTDIGGTFYDLSGFPGYRVELLAGHRCGQ